MASVLNKFEEKTKILASKVNQNFERLQSDIGTLDEEINSKLSNTKENILSDMQTVKESLENGKADITLGNIEPAQSFKDMVFGLTMPDYSKYEERTRETLYRAMEDGWILIIISRSDKEVSSRLYVGKTEDELKEIMQTHSNVANSSSSIYPIKRGWYYKTTGNGTYAGVKYGFVPNFNGVKLEGEN